MLLIYSRENQLDTLQLLCTDLHGSMFRLMSCNQTRHFHFQSEQKVIIRLPSNPVILQAQDVTLRHARYRLQFGSHFLQFLIILAVNTRDQYSSGSRCCTRSSTGSVTALHRLQLPPTLSFLKDLNYSIRKFPASTSFGLCDRYSTCIFFLHLTINMVLKQDYFFFQTHICFTN